MATPGMSREDFLRILEEGEDAIEGVRPTYSWVALLAELQKRETPFTVKQIHSEIIATGFDMPKNYVYSHLNGWAERKKLLSVKYGGRRFFMAPE